MKFAVILALLASLVGPAGAGTVTRCPKPRPGEATTIPVLPRICFRHR